MHLYYNKRQNMSNANNSNNEEFETVDQLADKQNLITCYQMQIDDNNECRPIYLGRYPDVPLPVNKIIKYKKYILHVVTYILTEQEIKDKLYKIVGVTGFRKNRKNSLFSLDLVLNEDNLDMNSNTNNVPIQGAAKMESAKRSLEPSVPLENKSQLEEHKQGEQSIFKGKYQLLFSDHKLNTTVLVENVEKFPGKDKVLEYIILKAFENPVKARLLK